MNTEFQTQYGTVKSEEFLQIYNQYNTLIKLSLQAQERSISDKSDKYINTLGLDIIGGKRKNRSNLINDYFDTLQKDLYDFAVLNLVATFEKMIFNRVSLAEQKSKTILASSYEMSAPFATSIKSFVKSKQDINNMSGVLNILSGTISTTLRNRLKEIIDYRNRIAHGKRFGKETDLTVLEIMACLDEVLEVAQ